MSKEKWEVKFDEWFSQYEIPVNGYNYHKIGWIKNAFEFAYISQQETIDIFVEALEYYGMESNYEASYSETENDWVAYILEDITKKFDHKAYSNEAWGGKRARTALEKVTNLCNKTPSSGQ